MLETHRAKECQRGTAGAEERAKEGGRALAEGSDTRLGSRDRAFESPHSDQKTQTASMQSAFFHVLGAWHPGPCTAYRMPARAILNPESAWA